MFNEAIEAISEGVGKLVNELRSDMNQRLEILKSEVKSGKTELKDEINSLKADLSAMASRSDLEELKSKLM